MAKEDISSFNKDMPKVRDIFPDLLLAFHRLGGSATVAACVEELGKMLELTDEQLNRVDDGNFSIFLNYVHLARLNLTYAGYLEEISRPVWGLSRKGKEKITDLIQCDEDKLDEFKQEVVQLANEEWKRKKKEKEEKQRLGVGEGEVPDNEEISKDQEREEQLEKEIDETTDEEIKKDQEEEEKQKEQLDKIRTMDPFAFERLCKKLFEAVGYEDAEETNKAKDVGIDGYGFIVFGLVRFKVVFQAKRYGGSTKISAEEIRALEGSKSQKKAEKAVFITTSDFTKSAKETAEECDISLVNGERLLKLLKKYRLGYSVKKVTTEYQFDENFF